MAASGCVPTVCEYEGLWAGADSYRRTANYCGAGLRYETAVPHDGLTPLPDAPTAGLPVGFVVVAGTLIVPGGLLILVNLVMLVGGWSVRRIRGTSMEPALSPGRRVVVRRARLADVRPGALVELAAGQIVPGGARIVGGRRLIKRAVALPGDPVPAGSVGSGRAGCPPSCPPGSW